jgi:hypothetical protein
MTAVGRDGSFKGRQFTSEVILWALRWYLAFPISYRELASMLSDRGIAVDGSVHRMGRSCRVGRPFVLVGMWLKSSAEP